MPPASAHASLRLQKSRRLRGGTVREALVTMAPPSRSPQRSELITVGKLSADAWRAHDSAIGDCVLTILGPAELARRQRALRQLDHPRTRREVGTVTVPNRGLGLLTTYLPGLPLSERDRRRTLSHPREALRIGEDVLDVLAHAHRRGVAHGHLAMRHVIVMSDASGVVGFGQAPAAASVQGDLRALAALLDELFTDAPGDEQSVSASRLHSDLGPELDDWLAALADSESGFRSAEHAQSALRVVSGGLPAPARRVEQAWF